MKLVCNVCGTEYQKEPSKTQTETRTGRKYIRCPKDGAVAYQEGWNEAGYNSEELAALQEQLNTEKAKSASLEKELANEKAELTETKQNLQQLRGENEALETANKKLEDELAECKASKEE